MNISRLDLNLLVVFLTIYREGTLTRSATLLNLSQPAISHALGRLREQFGDALFVRRGNRMVATARAEQLVIPVREALRVLELGLSGPPVFKPAETQREFRLGLRDVLEATALPLLLQELTKVAPGVSINSTRVDRRELDLELANGRLDLAVDVLLPLDSDIHRQPVTQDRLVVVASRQHPALHAGKLDMKTYMASGHVLVSSRRRGPGLEDVELARAGHERRIVLRCQHYFAACRVVENSELLLTMPEQYALMANAGYDTALYPTPFPSPNMDVYLYWHKSRDDDPANRWLRETIAGLFSREKSVN
jgi:DNA-binding transcriptional LysR family regulator